MTKTATKPEPITYPLHPLLVNTKNVEPLTEPIEALDVHRLTADGKRPMLAWVPADELPDELALLERFGPGSYEIVGRNGLRSAILRRAFVDVGEPVAAPPPSPAAPATSAPASPSHDVFALFERFERSRAEDRRELAREAQQQRERDAKQQETLLSVVMTSMQAMMARQAPAAPSDGGDAFDKFLDRMAKWNEAQRNERAEALAEQEVIREKVTEEVQATEAAKAKSSDADVLTTIITPLAEKLAEKMVDKPHGAAS